MIYVCLIICVYILRVNYRELSDYNKSINIVSYLFNDAHIKYSLMMLMLNYVYANGPT